MRQQQTGSDVIKYQLVENVHYMTHLIMFYCANKALVLPNKIEAKPLKSHGALKQCISYRSGLTLVPMKGKLSYFIRNVLQVWNDIRVINDIFVWNKPLFRPWFQLVKKWKKLFWCSVQTGYVLKYILSDIVHWMLLQDRRKSCSRTLLASWQVTLACLARVRYLFL